MSTVKIGGAKGGATSPVWTEEATATLRLMHAAGNSASQIGIALGCTRNATIGKLHRLGMQDKNRPIHLRNGVEAGKPMRITKGNNNPLGRNQRRRKHVNGFQLNLNKVRPAPRREPEPEPVLPLLGQVLFLDRPRKRCAFIADDPRAGPIGALLCCGEAVKAGKPYCRHHYARCFQPSRMSVRSATFVPGRAA